MRKLDLDEYRIAKMQATLFERSIKDANFSSPMFIRRFLMSHFAFVFFDKSFLNTNRPLEFIFDELNSDYKETTKSPMYSEDEMYWIGYIYAAICFLYDLRPKNVYKLFNARKIRDYYFIYHTFDIEQAAERMMENIGYSNDLFQRGLEILRRQVRFDKTKELLGKEINVLIKDSLKYRKIKIDEKAFIIKEGFIEGSKGLNALVIENTLENKNKISGTVVAIYHQPNLENDTLIVTNEKSINKSLIEKLILRNKRSYINKLVFSSTIE